ncbi:hypothetical protein [Candidatus Coxiella mudrowiae]|uniref:hypothetical protein n=1 Tax=Candidatus Coxiella mudrowiae TaxID=2054173 RepID=UPI0012FF1349|nr:hypothetical protein [Candidatus Coxiella mudrowiae]
MIKVYSEGNKFSPQHVTAKNKNLLSEAIWIDLLNPSEEEENLVEDSIGREGIPT